MELPESEAHHAARVLRLNAGEQVALFDGRGNEWQGAVAEIGKKRVTVQVETHQQSAPPPPLTLLLPQLLSDKTLEHIIDDCTALGATRFRIYRAARSERAPKAAEKWARTLVESCKQCGRLWLPVVTVYGSLRDALAEGDWSRLFVCDLDAPGANLSRDADERIAVLVGPEGDLTREEKELAYGQGALPMSLGELTLRTELACSVAVVLASRR